MDLNQLYFRHQILLMRASGTAGAASLRHESGAARIARSIGAFQHALGAKAAFAWQAGNGQ